MAFKKQMLIEAPASKLWDAWTQPEQLTQWLAPRVNISLVPEEKFEFFWDQDPTVNSTLGCVLKAIQPNEQLTFEWQGPPEHLHMFLPPEGRRTLIEVKFKALDKFTQLSLEQAETRDLADWPAYEAWMAPVWGNALNALKTLCESETNL